MKIVVCVKYVPDATAERRLGDDLTVDRAGDGLMSELDEYAVEQALRLKEKIGEETEVTALCVGPEQSIDAVRKALQMGADDGILVTDEAIAGSDYLATSLILAKAVHKLASDGRAADIVLCGMASTDASGGVVPAMLAERLERPQMTLASVVETQADQVRIRRDGDSFTEVVRANLPVVLSVTDQTGEARYPTFKGIMAAKKKTIDTWSLADLGIDADEVGLAVSHSEVVAAKPRPPKEAGTIVHDQYASGAEALMAFLVARKLVSGGSGRG